MLLVVAVSWLSLATPAPGIDPKLMSGGSAATGLVTHDRKPFSLEALRGKTVLLNFMFTSCPSVCPKQTKALQQVQQGLPRTVRERTHFMSVSIDPERDRPEALLAFAEKHRLDLSNWSFVTGPEADIALLSQNYSAQAVPEQALPLDHRTEVRLINASGKLMQSYAGEPLDVARLIREVQTVDSMFKRPESR